MGTMDEVLMGPPGYQAEFVGAFRFVLQIFCNWFYAMFIFFVLRPRATSLAGRLFGEDKRDLPLVWAAAWRGRILGR